MLRVMKRKRNGDKCVPQAAEAAASGLKVDQARMLRVMKRKRNGDKCVPQRPCTKVRKRDDSRSDDDNSRSDGDNSTTILALTTTILPFHMGTTVLLMAVIRRSWTCGWGCC